MRTLAAHSIGSVAANLQASVAVVDRTAKRLKLQPVLVLDNVKHFSDRQVERMREALAAKTRGAAS